MQFMKQRFTKYVLRRKKRGDLRPGEDGDNTTINITLCSTIVEMWMLRIVYEYDDYKYSVTITTI